MKNLLFLPLVFLLVLSVKNLDLSEPQESEYYFATREPTVTELIDHTFKEERFMAHRIIKCESGGRADATNYNTDGSTDRGLFQINSVHARKVNGDLDSLYDPKVNIQVAYQIFKASSWDPWVCAGKVGV